MDRLSLKERKKRIIKQVDKYNIKGVKFSSDSPNREKELEILDEAFKDKNMKETFDNLEKFLSENEIQAE